MKYSLKPILKTASSLRTASSLQTAGQISCYVAAVSGLLASPGLGQTISIDSSTPTLLNGGPSSSCTGNCTITADLADSRYANGTGPNLFHSFSTFNVEAGSTVTFIDPGVSNIFSRITDISPLNASNIDGTLKVDGNANLFLLNPNGIIFGNNATLDIQGSFLGSTANSLLFPNSEEFSATTKETPPLLSINSPIGLQFGTAPGAIEVTGSGHNLAYNQSDATITRNSPTTGLTAASGNNLALLGSRVTLSGGNLTAEAGHIEISGIGENSRVELDISDTDWTFDYTSTNSYGDIQLSQQSSIDVSGADAGSLRINGQQINISEGSALLAKTLTSGGGNVSLQASESINMAGVDLTATSLMPTSAYIEIAPSATGDGSSRLRVNAPQLNLTAGAQIGLSMGGQGSAGRVEVNVPMLNATGGANVNPSGIFAAVLPVFGPPPGAIGQGGDLNIEAEQLTITDGAYLITSTFGAGDAGKLTINATDVNVRGFSTRAPSLISSASEVPSIPPLPNGSGSGGGIEINTERLTVSEGGQISVSTNSRNPAGNIDITASDSVELIGETPLGRSGLLALARIGDGEGGNIQVNANRLSVVEGATINASNFSTVVPGPPPGSGAAGNINLSATAIEIKDNSLITTNTVSGDRANITLDADSLVLRRSSKITTNATGTATGGNIAIDAEALIAFENSDITANARDNFGGRIIVDAPTILGTAYREQATDDSDITASSDLGPAFSGSVELSTPEIDPTDGITPLPEGLSTEGQIVAACEQLEGNTFVATGRGGLPDSASSLLTEQAIWNDFRLTNGAAAQTPAADVGNKTEIFSPAQQDQSKTRTVIENETIIEAQTWSLNHQGQIVFGAHTNQDTISYTTSSSSCLG